MGRLGLSKIFDDFLRQIEILKGLKGLKGLNPPPQAEIRFQHGLPYRITHDVVRKMIKQGREASRFGLELLEPPT